MPASSSVLITLQLEQVAVGVPAPAAAARGVGQRRPDQVGAGPVVELAVRDADDLGGLRAAVTDARPRAHSSVDVDAVPTVLLTSTRR